MADATNLLALFREIAEDVDKKKLPDVTEKSVIADLGIDSLSTMQIVGELEQRLDVTIPDDQLVKLETVGDLLDVVKRCQEKAGK
ncbi:MAG: acyl carrier protein [Polyangiales bacterium]